MVNRREMAPETFDDLSAMVDRKGGVHTVKAAVLRDLHGAGKLGVNVREAIAARLAGVGLEAYPRNIPDRQYDDVRLIRRGSKIAKIIEAVEDISEGGNKHLRAVTSKEKAAEMLARLKEVVEEFDD